jgi:hypothetical protein
MVGKENFLSNPDENVAETSAWYRWFSRHEAEGHSPLWAELSNRVANDEELLAFLANLPKAKRQPNLFLASYRSLFGIPTDWTTFRSQVLASSETIAGRMLARSTQTNEPGRCAVLIPLMAILPQPLAIIEVGAAAGLCLLLDRYAYDYGTRQLSPVDVVDPPIFSCKVTRNTPLPDKLPEVSWRAGLDLNPLDVTDAKEMAWLETLVWPGQDHRLDRLRKAIAVARREPPRVDRGNLSADLKHLLAQVPSGLTTVVFHSAVLNYLPSQADRNDFAHTVMGLADHWIANESPLILPHLGEKTSTGPEGSFLLALDGEPVAWTNPHGASIEWIRG